MTANWKSLVFAMAACLLPVASGQVPPTISSSSFATDGTGIQHFDFVVTSGTNDGAQLSAVWVKIGHNGAAFACETVVGPAAYPNPANPGVFWQVSDDGSQWVPGGFPGLVQPSGGPNPNPSEFGGGIENAQCRLIGDGGSYTQIPDQLWRPGTRADPLGHQVQDHHLRGL